MESDEWGISNDCMIGERGEERGSKNREDGGGLHVCDSMGSREEGTAALVISHY